MNEAVKNVKGMTDSAMRHIYDNNKFTRDILILLYTPKV